jgi:hypothetical protein
MEAPRHYSASPLHSFVTVPTHRVVSFSAALRSIIAWLRGATPSRSELQLQDRLVERLVAELEAEAETNPTGINRIDKPPIMPKRPRRLTGREDR